VKAFTICKISTDSPALIFTRK